MKTKSQVTLTISILVSLIFFLSVLIETIPSTSLAMPLLGKYLVFTMILITLSVCATVFVLNIHFRTPSTHSMPHWVKHWCIDILPKYLFMNVPQYQSSQTNILPEQLIYQHNPAYANNSTKWPMPAQLILAQQQQQANNLINNSETNNIQHQSSLSSSLSTKGEKINKKLLLANKQASKDSYNINSYSKQQLHQLNPGSLELEATINSNLITINNPSSSLFLPYLQSEAARRLQMQRSRSSERDNNKNSSEHQQASSSTTTTTTTTSNNQLTNKNKNTSDCDTTTSTRQQTTVVEIPAQLKRRKSSSSSAQNKNSPSIWRLFSNKKSDINDNQTSSALVNHAKALHDEHSSAGGGFFSHQQQQQQQQRQQPQSSHQHQTTTSSTSDDDDDYEDYDYQHHNHFQARASVCSTNLWRIGPTRRCSVIAPVNYPTFYRPLTQPTPAACAGHISTISSGHYHHHNNNNSNDYDEDDESDSDGRASGMAVGALITAAASNLAIRPKERLQNINRPPGSNDGASRQDHHMMASSSQNYAQQQQQAPYSFGPSQAQNHYGQQQQYIHSGRGAHLMGPSQNPVLNLSLATPPPPLPPANAVNRQPLPSGGINPNLYSQYQNRQIPRSISHYNQSKFNNLLQQQQQQFNNNDNSFVANALDRPSAAAARVNLNGTINMLKPTTIGTSTNQKHPLFNHQQQHELVQLNNLQQQNVGFMPRSRSTDHRLCASLYGSSTPQQAANAATLFSNQHSTMFSQQQQQQPRSYTTSTTMMNNQSLNKQQVPVNSSSYLLQNPHSIGRALGQAYMQRLQRQPAVCSMQPINLTNRSILQQANSASFLLPLDGNNPNLHTLRQDNIFDRNNNINDNLAIRRCKSQTSLERRSTRHQHRIDHQSSCEHCSRSQQNDTIKRMNSQQSRADSVRCTNDLITGCGVCNRQYKTKGQTTCCLSNCRSNVNNNNNRHQMPGSINKRTTQQVTSLQLIRLINDVNKAIQNAMFIAQHIDNLDEFESVSYRLYIYIDIIIIKLKF